MGFLVGVTSANANGGVLQLNGGITFPATQVSASDANTLDDYEEGTWTPILRTSTSSTQPSSYNIQYGQYIKIGSFVHYSVRIDVGGVVGFTDANSLEVWGLPFTAATTSSGADWIGYASLGYYANFTGINASATQVLLLGVKDGSGGGSPILRFHAHAPNGGTFVVNAQNVQGGFLLLAGGSYRAAA